MSLKLANSAVSRLSSGISSGATTLTVMPGDGALFPVIGAGEFFPATLVKVDGTYEIIKVTARSADTFTVERAQEGTVAVAFAANDRIEHRMTAGTQTALMVEKATTAATSKTTPADADELPLVDSEDSFKLKKLTWANLKAGVFAAWGALINGGTAKTTPVDADAIAIMDSAASNATKKLTFANLKSWLLLRLSANVASAATVDLTGQLGKSAHITGTTGISAWTMTAGQVIDIIFDGILTLTHHATTNNLPGGVDIVTAAGDRARLFYDGATVYVLNITARTVAMQGASRNLVASASGTSANISVTIDELVTGDGAGNYQTTQSWSATLNTAASGANGLDTGAIAASTWYYVHGITKPDGTKAALASLSATAPTLPSGYTKWALISAFRTDATANKFPLAFKQFGKNIQYTPTAGSNLTAARQMAVGSNGAVLTAVSMSAFIPPNASRVHVELHGYEAGVPTQVYAAPNNTYGSFSSSTNPAPMSVNVTTGGGSMNGSFVVESANFYYASANANAHLICLGFELNL